MLDDAALITGLPRVQIVADSLQHAGGRAFALQIAKDYVLATKLTDLAALARRALTWVLRRPRAAWHWTNPQIGGWERAPVQLTADRQALLKLASSVVSAWVGRVKGLVLLVPRAVWGHLSKVKAMESEVEDESLLGPFLQLAANAITWVRLSIVGRLAAGAVRLLLTVPLFFWRMSNPEIGGFERASGDLL